MGSRPRAGSLGAEGFGLRLQRTSSLGVRAFRVQDFGPVRVGGCRVESSGLGVGSKRLRLSGVRIWNPKPEILNPKPGFRV